MSRFPTLPVEQARKLTANWRNYYVKIYNDGDAIPDLDPDGTEVFRGFRIPLDDLRQILETVDKFNDDPENEVKINSIRTYIAKDSDEVTRRDDIHLLLVPVVGGEEILPPLHNGNFPKFGRDLLETRDKQNGQLSSQIFNFTTPCPTECDTDSKLYSSR